MERSVEKYSQKLVDHGLVEEGDALLGGLDDEIVWSSKDPRIDLVEEIFDHLNINSLLVSRPAEPYRSMIGSLLESAGQVVRPEDTETRTFLHDFPVADRLETMEVVRRLKGRKSVLLRTGEIVTFGTVSMEQAFITFSSVCFSCYVKFMSDALAQARVGTLTRDRERIVLDELRRQEELTDEGAQTLFDGSYDSEKTVLERMAGIGRVTVGERLVDSFFGNISYRLGDTLYISQTGSSLDELEGCVDPCPMDGSSSAGMTASSELTTHMRVVVDTPNTAILHGHPRFSVILSMDCDEDCDGRDRCHVECERDRWIEGVPVVPGEVGNGRFGLCNTVPAALAGPGVKKGGVIVYGHGLFTVGERSLEQALERLRKIEGDCRKEFARRFLSAQRG